MLDAYAAGVNAFIAHDEDLADRVPAPRPPPRAVGAVGQPRRLQDPARRDGALADEALARPARSGSSARGWPPTCRRARPSCPMLIIPPGAEYRGPMSGALGTLLEHDPVLAPFRPGSAGATTGSSPGLGPPRAARSSRAILTAPSTRRTATTRTTSPARTSTPSGSRSRASPACPTSATTATWPGASRTRWPTTRTSSSSASTPPTRRGTSSATSGGSAEVRRETIQVRGGRPVDVTITVTHHGPIVLGDPASGHGVAVRYTATAEPNPTFDALRADAAGRVGGRARGGDAAVGRSGQQPGVRRRPRDDRLPDPRARAGPEPGRTRGSRSRAGTAPTSGRE